MREMIETLLKYLQENSCLVLINTGEDKEIRVVDKVVLSGDISTLLKREYDAVN